MLANSWSLFPLSALFLCRYELYMDPLVPFVNSLFLLVISYFQELLSNNRSFSLSQNGPIHLISHCLPHFTFSTFQSRIFCANSQFRFSCVDLLCCFTLCTICLYYVYYDMPVVLRLSYEKVCKSRARA